MNETTTRLLNRFEDEEYRSAYDEEFANSRMAMQIQVIRESQNLTQKQLAELAEMRQSRISALENVNYSMWTVSTLRRIAKALGVRFFFGFESWGELLQEVEELGRSHLNRPRFEKDPVFNRKRRHTIRTATQPFAGEMGQPFQQRLFIDKASLLHGGRKDTSLQSKPERLSDFSVVNQDRVPTQARALAQATPHQVLREAA